MGTEWWYIVVIVLVTASFNVVVSLVQFITFKLLGRETLGLINLSVKF